MTCSLAPTFLVSTSTSEVHCDSLNQLLIITGHFYFTKLLLPTLLSTAKTSGPIRIITVASTGALMTGGLKFDTFKDGPSRKKLGNQALYIQSKFGNIVVAQELARRYGEQGVVATSLNPGTLDSDLYRYVDNPVQKALQVCLMFIASRRETY